MIVILAVIVVMICAMIVAVVVVRAVLAMFVGIVPVTGRRALALRCVVPGRVRVRAGTRRRLIGRIACTSAVIDGFKRMGPVICADGLGHGNLLCV